MLKLCQGKKFKNLNFFPGNKNQWKICSYNQQSIDYIEPEKIISN